MPKRNKKMKVKTYPKEMRGSIVICNRTYELVWDPSQGGGRFTTDYDGTGRGRMIVGTKSKNLECILSILLHEIIESTRARDTLRWAPDGDESRPLLFVMTHDQLQEVCTKVTHSLLSSGAIGAA